jgi:hypothetical protein
MIFMGTGEPLAVAAIRTGDLATLQRLLGQYSILATATLGTDGADGMSRTLLHIVTDWPGHFPIGAATVALLIAAGADVNARFAGPHTETPLHWAASSDDVEVLDALLDAGADLEAPGAVIGGGSPLRDAMAFGQWRAARRLVERGAHATSFDAAALGLMDRPQGLRRYLGGKNLSPLDAAARSGATELVNGCTVKAPGRPATSEHTADEVSTISPASRRCSWPVSR